MKLRNLFLLLGVLWHQSADVSAAPSPPFKPSQPLPGPLDSSDQLALAYLEREATREKRGSASGSGDILKHITKSIGAGIKNKIGQIAKSSAGASAYFSKSSSAHHHGPPEHGPPEHGHHIPYPPPYPPPHFYPMHGYHHHHHDDKGMDIWNIKKSVLYTLLQAVKAIKGGVIAIKGQLIKGGGHLLTAKGKLIRGGGEALTSLGKNIALSAFHWIPNSHEEDEGVIHESPEAGEHPSAGYYSAPSAAGHDIPGGYGAPPSGAGGYYHNSVYDGKTSPQQHDGLIILRKIPKSLRHPDSDGDHSAHTHDDHNQPQPPHQHQHQHQHQHEESHQAQVEHDPRHQPYQQHAHAHAHEQDVEESQKTPAFRPLSDGIVPKMKHLVTSVFQSSVYPPPSAPSAPPGYKHYDAGPAPSHSQYAPYVKPPQQAGGNVKVQPQQAHVGSLVNYLEYIRSQTQKQQQQQQQQKTVPKDQNSVYVTPAPVPSESKPKLPKVTENKENEVTPEQIKHEQALLEQQLQQLASLQSLQHQLQLANPYAGDLVQYQEQGHAQGQGQAQGQYQPVQHQQQPQLLPGQINYDLAALAPHQGHQPVVLDLPANVDLATMLAQYQIVPESAVPTPAQQYPQYLEDPMAEAESSNINTFLIHVPDDDEEHLKPKSKPKPKPKPKPKAKAKRHSGHSRPPPTVRGAPLSKLKQLSHLQQVQLMQQQLHHHQHAPKSSKSSSPSKRSPTFDVIRSISFELGPEGGYYERDRSYRYATFDPYF